MMYQVFTPLEEVNCRGIAPNEGTEILCNAAMQIVAPDDCRGIAPNEGTEIFVCCLI